MIELLVFVLVVILIAVVVNYVLAQVPGVPSFASAIVWLIALVIIIMLVLRAFGYSSHF